MNKAIITLGTSVMVLTGSWGLAYGEKDIETLQTMYFMEMVAEFCHEEIFYYTYEQLSLINRTVELALEEKNFSEETKRKAISEAESVFFIYKNSALLGGLKTTYDGCENFSPYINVMINAGNK